MPAVESRCELDEASTRSCKAHNLQLRSDSAQWQALNAEVTQVCPQTGKSPMVATKELFSICAAPNDVNRAHKITARYLMATGLEAVPMLLDLNEL